MSSFAAFFVLSITGVRKIAKIVHMSFRDIGDITNKVKLQADRERGQEGKNNVEVVVSLDLPASDISKILGTMTYV